MIQIIQAESTPLSSVFFLHAKPPGFLEWTKYDFVRLVRTVLSVDYSVRPLHELVYEEKVQNLVQVQSVFVRAFYAKDLLKKALLPLTFVTVFHSTSSTVENK
jgi:hypothetical protein